jgi:hypothetical protein
MAKVKPVDVFKMMMEFDPESKENWLIEIKRIHDESTLMIVFIRDQNLEETKEIGTLLAISLRAELRLGVTVEAIYQNKETEPTFNEFFSYLLGQGIYYTEFERIAVNNTTTPVEITVKRR